MEKKLVIISVGVELSPVLSEFLAQNDLGYKIILNTLCDFQLSDREKIDNGADTSDVWYSHEIVKLANSLVPDDLTQSSLAKLFSRPIAQTKLPLTDAERFLVQWVSERKKADQNFSEFFSGLTQYAGKPIEISSLKFPEEIITLQIDTLQIPLRYFQITGYIDRKAEQKTDLEELQQLLVDSEDNKEAKGKKKGKKPIEILGIDPNRDILTEEAKKHLSEADGILILAGDPCSLAILLKYKEFTRALKEIKAPSMLISPSRYSFREQFILDLLGVKPPSLQGIAEGSKGVFDHLLVNPDEAGEVATLRSKGYNVIMEDITKLEAKKGLGTITKGVGIALKELSVDYDAESEEIKSIDDLVTQLSVKAEEEVQKEPEVQIEEVSSSKGLEEEIVPEKEEDQTPEPIELLDTKERNFDFVDPSLDLTQDMIEGLMQELSNEFPTTPVKEPVPKAEGEEEITDQTTSDFETQESFTKAIQSFLQNGISDDSKDLINGIKESIEKNADMAAYAANKFTASFSEDTDLDKLIPIYLDFFKTRDILFSKQILDWLLLDLKSPNYVLFSQKALVIVKMSKYNMNFTEKIIEQMVDYHINKSLPPKEREHVRTLIGMITARDITLQRSAISSYLSHYEDSRKLDEIWLGLLKFDAALVAVEIIEHQNKLGVQIVQDVLMRKLGSFGHVIYDVFNAYQKGDVQRVLTIAGTVSDGLLRKRKRIELAEKITKFGSVPIETLARSVEMDPSELESLVYEMINESELKAKIEVVEGRLCIVQFNDQEKDSKDSIPKDPE